MMNNFKLEKSLAVSLLSVTTLFGVGCKKQKPAQAQTATGVQKGVADSQNPALAGAQTLLQHLADMNNYLTTGVVSPYVYDFAFNDLTRFMYDLYLAPHKRAEKSGDFTAMQADNMTFIQGKMKGDHTGEVYSFHSFAPIQGLSVITTDQKPGYYYLGKARNFMDPMDGFTTYLGVDFYTPGFATEPTLMKTASFSEKAGEELLANLFVAKRKDTDSGKMTWVIFKWENTQDREGISVIKTMPADLFVDTPQLVLASGHVFIFNYAYSKNGITINHQADLYSEDVNKALYLSTVDAKSFNGEYVIDLKADPAASGKWTTMRDGIIFTKSMDHTSSWVYAGPAIAAVLVVAATAIISGGAIPAALAALAPEAATALGAGEAVELTAITTEVAGSLTAGATAAVTAGATTFGATAGFSAALGAFGSAMLTGLATSPAWIAGALSSTALTGGLLTNWAVGGIKAGSWEMDKTSIYRDHSGSGYHHLTAGQEYIRVPHKGSDGDLFVSINTGYTFDESTTTRPTVKPYYFMFQEKPHWSFLDANGNYDANQHIPDWSENIWGFGMKK